MIHKRINTMYDIESYLDSLPEDSAEINVSHRDITYLDVTRFKNLKTLHCECNKLTSLHLNEKMNTLFCNHNQLTSLNLNKNLKILYCSYNKLTSLQLNEKLETLYCNNNQLSSLHLNEKLQGLYCYHNQLTSLHLNENLQGLYCCYNQLTTLYLNENLKELYCSNNQLTSLRINNLQTSYFYHNKLTYLSKNVRILEYSCNPIYEIIKSNNKNIINQKIQILNQFRYLYYCLKFKKMFRDWLWVKIREPKIRKKYSHDYLVEHLHEDTDLDELLNNW